MTTPEPNASDSCDDTIAKDAAPLPWITVHTLGEFVFCPRAGLIAYDAQGTEDVDDEPLTPRVNFLPDFSLPEIELRLAKEVDAFDRRFRAVAVASIVGFLGWFNSMPLLLVGSGLGLAVGGWLLSDRVGAILVLARRREAARAARAGDPQLRCENGAINWWQILAGGASSLAYKISLRCDEMRLIGKPWRVLRFASLRVPVIRPGSQNDELQFLVRPQHRVRLAAYAHLLSRCEGAEAPCGIVLKPGEYNGERIAMTDSLFNELGESLTAARAASLNKRKIAMIHRRRKKSTAVVAARTAVPRYTVVTPMRGSRMTLKCVRRSRCGRPPLP